MNFDARVDLVFTYFTDTWADAVEREFCFTVDRSIVEAARHPRVRGLMIVNPSRSLPVSFLRRLQGRRPPPLPTREPPALLVQPFRLRRRDPTDVLGLEGSYASYGRRLDRAFVRSGLDRPAVVTANPFVAAFCSLRSAGSVTYYGYDDWAELDALRPWWPAIEVAYHRIAQRGLPIAAVSQTILDRIGPRGPSRVIPNGVEPSEWEPPWAELPPECELRRPLLLYVGNIGHRLDVEMLEATAARFPEGEIVLIGAVGDPSVLGRLAAIPNLRVERRLERRRMAALVHAADACLMPHRATGLTSAMSPLKVYEYLAAGRPVVATDLPPIREVNAHVVRVPADDAEGYAHGVSRALALGPLTEAQRRDFIAANSWGTRFESLLALVTGQRTRSE